MYLWGIKYKQNSFDLVLFIVALAPTYSMKHLTSNLSACINVRNLKHVIIDWVSKSSSLNIYFLHFLNPKSGFFTRTLLKASYFPGVIRDPSIILTVFHVPILSSSTLSEFRWTGVYFTRIPFFFARERFRFHFNPLHLFFHHGCADGYFSKRYEFVMIFLIMHSILLVCSITLGFPHFHLLTAITHHINHSFVRLIFYFPIIPREVQFLAPLTYSLTPKVLTSPDSFKILVALFILWISFFAELNSFLPHWLRSPT
jgi:hypothetical protein